MSEYAISESLFLTKSRYDCVLRTEARTGVCGSLKKIADEIDNINRSSGEIDPSRIIEKMESLRKNILAFKDNINSVEDKAWVFPQLREYADEQVPTRAQAVPQEVVSKEIQHAYVKERRQLMRSMSLEP